MMTQVWTVIYNAFYGVMNTIFERFHQATGLFWVLFGLFLAYSVIRFFINPFLQSGLYGIGSDSVTQHGKDVANHQSAWAHNEYLIPHSSGNRKKLPGGFD